MSTLYYSDDSVKTLGRAESGDGRMIESEYMEEAICPYCGYRELDSWQLEDEGINECDRCGKGYYYERLIEITYTTWTSEEED